MDEHLEELEHNAQKARDLMGDKRYPSFLRFIKASEQDLDDEIHDLIQKGGEIGRIRTIEAVKRWLEGFREFPQEAVLRLKFENQDTREKKEIELDNPFTSSPDAKQEQKEIVNA